MTTANTTLLNNSLTLAVQHGDISLEAANAVANHWAKLNMLGFTWNTVVYEEGYNIAQMHGMVSPMALDDILDWMKSLDPEEEKFLVMNSPGGDAFTGVAMANALARDGNVTVVVDGMAYSAASVAMQGAAKRVMLAGAQQGIHKAWTLAIGNSDDLVNEAARLESMDTGILEIYSKRCSLKEGELVEMIARDTLMDRKRAVECGLADEAPEDSPLAGRRLPGQETKEMRDEKEADEPIMAMADDAGKELVRVPESKEAEVADTSPPAVEATAPETKNKKDGDWMLFLVK